MEVMVSSKRVPLNGTQFLRKRLHTFAFEGNIEGLQVLLDGDKQQVNRALGRVNTLRTERGSVVRPEFFRQNVSPFLMGTARDGLDYIRITYRWRGVHHRATALHVAAIQNQADAVMLLLNYGANIRKSNQFGMTPMHMAVMNDSLAVVKCLKDALLARGQNPWEKSFPTGIFYKNYEHFRVFNRSFYEGGHWVTFTPMTLAAINDRWVVLKYILEDPSASGDNIRIDVRFLIYGAAANNQVEVVEALLNYGISPNLPKYIMGYRDCKPLHVASMEGRVEVAKLLLERGADPKARMIEYQDQPYEKIRTPIHLAAIRGSSGVVNAILEKDKTVAMDRDKDGLTALYLASAEGKIDAVNALLKMGLAGAGYFSTKGKDTPVSDKEDKDTPLHIAIRAEYPFASIIIRNSFIDVVNALLKSGASPDVFNNWGETPLHKAIQCNRLDMVTALLQHGANANAQMQDRNQFGWTPLHTAVKYGDLEIVKILLECGASPNKKATSDWPCKGRRYTDPFSPLDLALSMGHFEIIRKLMQHGGKSLVKGVLKERNIRREWEYKYEEFNLNMTMSNR